MWAYTVRTFLSRVWGSHHLQPIVTSEWNLWAANLSTFNVGSLRQHYIRNQFDSLKQVAKWAKQCSSLHLQRQHKNPKLMQVQAIYQLRPEMTFNLGQNSLESWDSVLVHMAWVTCTSVMSDFQTTCAAIEVTPVQTCPALTTRSGLRCAKYRLLTNKHAPFSHVLYQIKNQQYMFLKKITFSSLSSWHDTIDYIIMICKI